MKVQLRRWFAIGLTSGALAVSMLAGSGAVGAAAAGSSTATDSRIVDNFEQRGDVFSTTAAPNQLVTVVSINAATSVTASDYLQNREIRD